MPHTTGHVPDLVDGFVRESVDELMTVARFRWVASGDPSTVGPAVLWSRQARVVPRLRSAICAGR
ncbi:hypothetical protein [Streptomyces sp. NPDC007205]|uniref:hypothetical protein n=1 Tax=Streptomyces sp. NPDC007205 TaxID=3154316 RepID=UPI0033E9F5C9